MSDFDRFRHPSSQRTRRVGSTTHSLELRWHGVSSVSSVSVFARSRAAYFFLRSIDTTASVAFVQAIHLMVTMLMHAEKATTGGEASWPLLRLAVAASQSVRSSLFLP